LAVGADARVKTLVLWNGVADGGSIIKEMITPQRVETLGQQGKADYNGNWVSQRFVQEFLTMKPAAALAKHPIPTLLVQAMEDTQVHPSQVDLFQQALQGDRVHCEKMLVPGSDHVFSSAAWEEAVIQRTVRWFVDILRG
jgi:dipeptidyl aminopeptidase/acylaminoacyl peptidase